MRNRPLPCPTSLLLILGLPMLLQAQDRPDAAAAPRPAWLDAVLREMRAHERYALAFVVPEDARRRGTLGKRLAALCNTIVVRRAEGFRAPADPQAQALAAEAELLCLPATLAHARPGETVVLLAPDGTRVRGAKVDLRPERGAVAALQALLRQDDLLAKRERSAASKEVMAALDMVVDPRSEEDRQVARTFLLRRFDGIAAAIVARRERELAPERRRHVDDLILSWLEARVTAEQPKLPANVRGCQADALPPRSLPYGVQWRWSAPQVEADPCPACGMMVMPARSLELVKFLLD